MGALTLVTLGFLLGVRHAVDPDHVVAVGTMATRSSSFRRSASLGALWGAGHTLTVMTVGGAIVLMRTALAPRVALLMEFAVALMLIVLGLINIVGARNNAPPPSNVRPLIVGMVHGMAGSAAIALLVLATIRDSTLGLIYLLCFGAGTVAGMIAVTALLVLPFALLVGRVGVSRRWLAAASGLVSVGVGMLLAQSLGGAAALFAAAPAYIAR
jgi:ABC-type nickel/cobalt efflux system permease component RcnA